MTKVKQTCATLPLPEVRCCKCSRLLFYGYAQSVKIKCPRCGTMQTFATAGNERTEINLVR